MKKYICATMIGVYSALALAGCGGGGGGGGGGAVTKAITKVYLFGNITSSGKVVATVQTTLNLPAGVLVNYSSAPGIKTGTFPLRKGVVVSSGPIKILDSGISGTYKIVDGIEGGTLQLLMLNLPGTSQVALKSSTSANSGSGVEIATVVFTLVTPGSLPTSMPLKDSAAAVGQDLLSTHDISYPVDSETHFLTTYQ